MNLGTSRAAGRLSGTGAVDAQGLRVLGLLAVVVAGMVWVGGPAGSEAFPGENGTFAFVGTRDGNRELYTLVHSGSDQTRLTDDVGADYWPTWSPDGTKVACYSYRDGRMAIHVMDAGGSNQSRLTDSSAEEFMAAWQRFARPVVCVQANGWSVTSISCSPRSLVGLLR
jgi:Tol biopolymer transport system component